MGGAKLRHAQDLWQVLEQIAACAPGEQVYDEASDGYEEDSSLVWRPSQRRAIPMLDPDYLGDPDKHAQDLVYNLGGYTQDRDPVVAIQMWRRFRAYVNQRSLLGIQSMFPWVYDFVTDAQGDALHKAFLGLIQKKRSLIYDDEEAGDVQDHRSVIVGINEHLARRIAQDQRLLRELSPRAFEEFMADIFSGFGYGVELTARTRDGGKDLIAIKNEHGILIKLLIECKRYLPPNSVGVGVVRQLYAVKQIERATKALLVTTSYFTRGARELEQQHLCELELKDFSAISAWAREYSVFLAGMRGR